MNRIRVTVCAAVLLFARLPFAQSDPLAGLGRLVVSGRGAEARAQMIKVRDQYIADKNASGEAAVWLLLGITDIALDAADSARANLTQAEAKFLAIGDHFGAWMSLWMVAEIANRQGHTDDAIAAHERSLALLREAADPSSRFSIETLKVLGPVFGAPTDLLGPLSEQPQLVKPIFLQFANVIARDEYANVLVDAGRDLEKAEAMLAEATAGSSLFGGMFDYSIYSHTGDLRRQQWRLEEARESYLKAMKGAKVLPDTMGAGPILEVDMLGKLAQLELLSGRVEEALEWNQRALTLVRAANNQKREAAVLESRAGILQNAGRYDAARAMYDEALKVATAIKDVGQQASIHSALGTINMFEGAYGTAAKQLEKAIGLYQTLNEPLLESTTWLILAEVHMLLGADGSADFALDNARTLAKKSRYKLAESTVEMITAMRSVTGGPGKQTDAAAAFRAWTELSDTKTLMMGEAFPEVMQQVMRMSSGERVTQIPALGPNMPQIVRWMPLFLEGKMLIERGDFPGARRVLNEALAVNPGGDLRAGVLGLIGATHWREGNRAEGLRYFKDAAKALDASAGDVRVEELLAGFLGSQRRVYYDLLIDMLVQEGHTDQAFAQSERARARAFLQLVGNHRFNAEQGADPRLVREAEILRTHIIERERELKNARGAEAERIAADLQRERERYKIVMIRVKTSNPEYASLTSVEPLELAKIRADIPADATLISYFVSLNGIHAWVLDRNETHYAAVPVHTAGLRRIVCWADQFGPRRDARGVALPNTCGDAATAEEAFDKLFAPLAKHVKTGKVVLVPHGILHYVPFAALRNRQTNRHLIDDYTLTYAPSASALRFLRAKETPVDGGAMVLGDPASPLPGLKKLPGAEQEANTIARTLGAKPHLGADARESLVYGLGGKFDLVHLAAHGLYDAANPLFSRIALAAGDAHDGSLTVHEILSSVDLTGVNLMVLSACRTAVGARSGGDEVVGLTRALLYAGTPGVLSTLWNIDDTTSAGLMDEFYRRLAAGAPAAEALRQAQLAIKESDGSSDPKYWAAFTLHGDPQGRWKSGQ